ncbi:MAG: Arm DNA-binding domain-containing protein, partial [Bacteroidota bacterium]
MRVQQTSVKIHQDARESSRKKDGTYPVRLIIRHNGKPAPVTTPYSFLKQDWNPEKNRARGTVENSGRINAKLKWMKLQADNLIED